MKQFFESVSQSFKNILVELLRVTVFVLIFLAVIEVVRLIFKFIFGSIGKLFHQDKFWVFAFWGIGSILFTSLIFAVFIGLMRAVGTLLRKRHPHDIK
jgi:hypothetical protein